MCQLSTDFVPNKHMQTFCTPRDMKDAPPHSLQPARPWGVASCERAGVFLGLAGLLGGWSWPLPSGFLSFPPVLTRPAWGSGSQTWVCSKPLSQLQSFQLHTREPFGVADEWHLGKEFVGNTLVVLVLRVCFFHFRNGPLPRAVRGPPVWSAALPCPQQMLGG